MAITFDYKKVLIKTHSITMEPSNGKLICSHKKIEEINNLRSNPKSGKTVTKYPHVRKNTRKYCWSHGAYSHTGKDCKVQFRKEGHKEYATFISKMGGLAEYCKNWMFGTDNKVKITNKLNLIQRYLLSVGKVVIPKGDSGATNRYWKKEDIACSQMVQRVIGPEVILPHNSVIKSDQQGHLPISKKLSSDDQKATVLPHLKSSSLVSLVKLCDDKCKVLLDRKNLYVVKNKE